MKKMFFAFAAFVAMSFASCGGNAEVAEGNDTIAVDTVEADTVVVDSVAVDSVFAD